MIFKKFKVPSSAVLFSVGEIDGGRMGKKTGEKEWGERVGGGFENPHNLLYLSLLHSLDGRLLGQSCSSTSGKLHV